MCPPARAGQAAPSCGPASLDLETGLISDDLSVCTYAVHGQTDTSICICRSRADVSMYV